MIKKIFDRIRFLSRRRQEPYLSFYRLLGFYPKDIEYYQLAVRHRSASRRINHRILSNERLEFLGDATLNSIVSDILYNRYPNAQEGFLTDTRSKIVKRDSLNLLAVKIGLDKLVISNKQINRHTNNNNMYGNAMEALIGAIYLDCGYRKCKQFVEKQLFGHFIDLDKVTKDEVNFKSRLIEWCQKRHLQMQFILLDDVSERNNHTFTSALEIDGNHICTGFGSSKKRSEQDAACTALKMIDEGSLLVEETEEDI